MECVHSLDEIRENMAVLRPYFVKKIERENLFALERMKQGNRFFSVKKPPGYKIFPTRFVGYATNHQEGNS